MWIRPSDRRYVYLECCVRGCGKSDFKTVRGLLSHMAAQPNARCRKGHGLKDFLENHFVAIERRGRLASIGEAPVDE